MKDDDSKYEIPGDSLALLCFIGILFGVFLLGMGIAK